LFDEKEFTRGAKVAIQGMPSKYIFLVIQGEFEISRNI